MTRLRMVFVAATVLLCSVGWFIRSQDAPNLLARLSPPSLQHWAGTDQLGRDVLNRTLRAASVASAVALPAWAIATFIGLFVGVIGAVCEERLIGRAIDWAIRVIFATPSFLVLVGLGVVLGRGMSAIFTLVLLLGWAYPARHARAVARDILSAPYTRAAINMGFAPLEIARYVLVPACFRPVLAASGGLIVEIFALDLVLTLFGFGPPPPSPTFGILLSDGLRFLDVAPWTVYVPIAVICMICLCFRATVRDNQPLLVG